MGIKGLNTIIRKYADNSIKEIFIDQLAFKKIAIDTSLFLYKYKAIFRDRWITCFIQLVSLLRKYDVHCIFVFDGQSPVEKNKEKEKRKQNREKLKEKYEIIQNDLENYKNTGLISELLLEIQNKYSTNITNRLLGGRGASDPSGGRGASDPSGGKVSKINVNLIEEHLCKLKDQQVSMTKEDILLIKNFLNIVSVPYIQSQIEGETLCCHLCKWGLVDGVLSEDTDVLSYGTPLFLFDINIIDGKCKMIDMEELLYELDMTQESFTDMCIMCGCDYNSNIKGVGIETSYKLIKEFKSIDNLPDKYDKDNLNYIRVRELFKIPELEDIKIGYCGIPNKKEFYKFMFENNVKLNFDMIYSNFYREIKFLD